MTDAHQDVAGVVERLRGDPNGNYSIVRKESATLIESLSKALSEAEANRDEWKQAAQVEAGLRREFLARAEAAESHLSEAMKVIEPFASRDMSDINDCIDNHGMRYQSQWFADATAAARSFLNAGKE
jgi:hypothetical protein